MTVKLQISELFDKPAAELLRVSAPGFCHAEHDRFNLRSTWYFKYVSFSLYCMSFLSCSVYQFSAQVNRLWRQAERENKS